MKLKYILSIFLLTGALFVARSTPETLSGNKHQRILNFADKAFKAYSFEKAARYYEEAFELNSSQETAVKLASCHQKLNDHREALNWYKKALEMGKLSEEHMLNYGLVLASAGRYDEASAIMKNYGDKSGWVQFKVKGFESLESFYHYEEAYTIQEAIFNTSGSEFSPAFYEDGLVIVASRPDNNPLAPKFNWDNSSFLDLYQIKDGEAPSEMGNKLNTRYHEGPAVFFDNDTKVIFTRNQYEGDNSRLPGEFVNHLKLFYSERRENGKWDKPVMLPFNKAGYSCGHPAISEDGSELYFASDMGESGGTDIFKVTFDGENWSDPVALQNGINTGKDEMFPFFQSGKLYFASSGHAGLGGLDVFRVDLRDSESKPENMGYPINTEFDDFGLVWSGDGEEGYFSSNREGGSGSDDIYKVKVFDYQLSFKLTDVETGEPLSGMIEIMEQPQNKVVSRQENSTAEIKVLRGAEIAVKGMAEGYGVAELMVDTKSLSLDDRNLEYEVKLKEEVIAETWVYTFTKNGLTNQLYYSDGTSWIGFEGDLKDLKDKLEAERINILGEKTIDNVPYEFDEHSVSETASVELDKLVDFLSKNTGVKVELTGRADTRGGSVYNQTLSEKRVNAAREYLIAKGIDKERILTKARGEEDLLISCGDECTDPEHEANRRTEIIILSED